MGNETYTKKFYEELNKSEDGKEFILSEFNARKT